MKERPLRILLADDHALVRAGTKEILSREVRAEFVETVDARATIDAACNQGPWDVILLDITMPGRSGLDVLCDLKKSCPKTPILMLSAHEEEQFAMRALRAGASGYLSKSGPPSELIKGVVKVLGGGQYVSEKFAEALALTLQRGKKGRSHESLSAREFEVLRMIVHGKSGKEIASELSISFKTVSTYRTRLMDKLGVHSNAQLAQYAAREDLV
ncbi:MAG: response regulator transcription factor [Verrucomicrobiota bacterium]|nr:response regulator transcription factor [Verrucomicrobiota bacterium]